MWSCPDDIERMPTNREEVHSVMTEMPVIISRADKYPTPTRTYPSSYASSVEAVDPHSTLVEEAEFISEGGDQDTRLVMTPRI
jgi:hypothetical protein